MAENQIQKQQIEIDMLKVRLKQGGQVARDSIPSASEAILELRKNGANSTMSLLPGYLPASGGFERPGTAVGPSFLSVTDRGPQASLLLSLTLLTGAYYLPSQLDWRC